MIPKGSKLCGNCKRENPCSCQCHTTNLINCYHVKIWDTPVDIKIRDEIEV